MGSSLEKFAAAMGPRPDEVTRQVKEALREEHQALHNPLADIAYGTKIVVSLLQRLLQRVEEGGAIPKGAPYTIVQASPAQNTAYNGSPIPVNGKIDGILVGGPGNVSVNKIVQDALTTTVLLATVPCNGGPVFIPFTYKIAAGNFLSIQTDSAAATSLSLAAHFEPVGLTGTDQFRLVR